MSNTALIDPRVAIIIAYAPAGLGHLRVSKALYQGLPPEAEPILLPDTAMSIQSMHRIMSTVPWAKRVMEWSQSGIAEGVMTTLYRKILRSDAKKIKVTLKNVLKQRVELPHTLLIVATHFGTAHQVAVIKDALAREAKVKVLLVVQVTDDSPQKMWYVPNANMITVPSRSTKKILDEYGKAEGLIASPIKVLSYPVSPRLTEKLSPEAYNLKLAQASPHAERMISISVPISGAAVGTTYASAIMQSLHHHNKRFHFHVIVKRTLFTSSFLSSALRKDYITTYQSHSDRQVVELYEQAYAQNVQFAEITKPSEQAFKALISPEKRGGAIMFFTTPVGRQEYDNLHFLRRHKLLLSVEEGKLLYDVFKSNNRSLSPKLIYSLSCVRGIMLPEDPHEAATFIQWLHTANVFTSMIHHHEKSILPEVSDAGVSEFWKHVKELL